jgi:hypothetical protein
MSRLYEVMFIVRPDVEDEEADKLIESFECNGQGRRRRSEVGGEDGAAQAGLPGAQV